eukprot:jgi/Phyca11/118100/e_gw1.35.194.1
MLSRGQRASRRLLTLSVRASSASSATSTLSSISSSRRGATRRLRPSRSPRISISRQHQPSLLSNRTLLLRSFSQVTSSHPPVPQDEYDELKSFLAEPTTSGPSMERARSIVTEWMQLYVDPAMPGMDATVMVMVADAMHDPHFVMQVYTCLRDAGVSPSPLTLEYSAAACAQLGQWRTALEIIDFMHQAVEIMQPSLDIYENAIASCHVAKKWMRAKHLLEEMRTYGLEASPELHVASIRLCIDIKEATASRVLLDGFLQAYKDELDEEDQQEIVVDLFHAAVDAQSLSQALFFRDELQARHFPVLKELYSRLIHLCATERQWYKARELLQQFVDINARPPKAVPPNRFLDNIHRLLAEMQTHNIEIPLEVFNAALRHFGQVALFDDAAAVYSKMRQYCVTPDAISYAALICSCGVRVEQSQGFFDELQRQKCDPTLDVVHGYLLVASRAKQWEEVLRRYAVVQHEESLFKDLPLESDVRIQSLLAVGYGRLHRPEEMLRVFTSMKVKGMEPNLHVYGAAMFAYIARDQWRHALMLFDHLFQQQTPEMQEQRVLENFPTLWDAAILACVEGNETERAAVLLDTIVEQHISISMISGERLVPLLTAIPSEVLWNSFKPISSLHRTKNNEQLNPRVQNAVLKRVVEENDNVLAERIVADAVDELQILPNSMTYALMLRLYARREDQEKFHVWWRRMDDAKVKPTVFIFRALMQELSILSVECDDYAAEVGRVALDVMERRGMAPDTICLQNYLLLSQEPDHVARALKIVEHAMTTDEDNAQECVHLSPRLLHTLFTALANFPDEFRVRKLLVEIVRVLPSDLSEDALAAYCAANDGHRALQLLRELVDAKCTLKDEHVLFFLTNSYTCETSSLETETSRPRSGHGVIVDMAELLCESDTVEMEAETLAFLIKHIVELSKWQQRDVYELSTQEEIKAMKMLLVRAFSHFSITQVTEFLSKVVDQDDFAHISSVLYELQGQEPQLDE